MVIPSLAHMFLHDAELLVIHTQKCGDNFACRRIPREVEGELAPVKDAVKREHVGARGILITAYKHGDCSYCHHLVEPKACRLSAAGYEGECRVEKRCVRWNESHGLIISAAAIAVGG